MNKDSDTCDEGQTHGHEGFLLIPEEAETMIGANPRNADVIRPYIIGDDFLSENPPQATRFVIDFAPRDLHEAQAYTEPFRRVQRLVLPKREENAQKEEERNREARRDNPRARVNLHHRNFLKNWWQLSYSRQDLLAKLAALPRYVCCSRVTKRPIFVFVSSSINPSDAVSVFTFVDDYSFGILQSGIHWLWFTERCSTLTERFRYTSNTVYDSFPWPQSPTLGQARAVAKAAVELRQLRDKLIEEHGYTLRKLYRTLELPGDNALKKAHERLDAAVRRAYDMGQKANSLEFLFQLNQTVAEREASMQQVVGPGLPPCVRSPEEFVSRDCIAPV